MSQPLTWYPAETREAEAFAGACEERAAGLGARADDCFAGVYRGHESANAIGR